MTLEQSMKVLRALSNEPHYKQPITKSGSTKSYGFTADGCRYTFDYRVCHCSMGWKQFDTQIDSETFGIWYHLEERVYFMFSAGSMFLVESPDQATFEAEMVALAENYEEPPPAFISYDYGQGSVTRTTHYSADARPFQGERNVAKA